jgi:hypothetical protein
MPSTIEEIRSALLDAFDRQHTWRDTEATPLPDDAIVRVALSRS